MASTADELMFAATASSGPTSDVFEHPFGLPQLAKASRPSLATFDRGFGLGMHLVKFGGNRPQVAHGSLDRGPFVSGERFIGIGLQAAALELRDTVRHREIHSSAPSCRYTQPSMLCRRTRRRKQTRSHRAALASFVIGKLSIRSSISWSGWR